MISPRLRGILGILLEHGDYVTVDRIATELGVSRRSIFRETEGIGRELGKYGLALDAKAGNGIMLAGRDEDKSRLAEELSAHKSTSLSKRDRHIMLAFLLMDEADAQKLAYYAPELNVSEATVSLDMDALENRLAPFRLAIERKSGVGVKLTGNERDKRRAYTSLAASFTDRTAVLFDRPPKQIYDAIAALTDGELRANLAWMTDDSLDMLKIQLAVMVDRVRGGFHIDGENEDISGLPRRLAEQLCDHIEEAFSISLSARERTWAAVLVQAARAKQPTAGGSVDSFAFSYAQSLVYRMIDAFDASLSPSLKLNENLVNGLSLHVWSAIVRIKQGIELKNTMREQIQSAYPEVYEKSVLAAKVLEQELGGKVSENEASFIASHFGAALLHIGERGGRHIVLRAGVVCVAGIGVSYMMQSQIKSRFRGELDVAVSDWNSPDEWEGYDLLITSVPLEYDRCPVIMTHPILTEEDYGKIRGAIKTLVNAKRETMPKPASDLPGRMRRAAERFTATAQILESFCRVIIHGDCTFDELAKMAGYRFGSNPENGRRIYDDLCHREGISPQTIPQLGIILLHARTAGVGEPVLAVITPEGMRFTDDRFMGARGAVVMLVPQGDKDTLEAFGYASGALTEDDVLLAAVQSGDEAVVYTRIEAVMLKYLADYCSGNLNMNFTERKVRKMNILELSGITLGLASETHTEAIRRCGRALVNGGYVNERYIEGMLARDENFSTAIGNHLAIPHGEKQYKGDIIKTGIVVLAYPNGIEWNGDNVRLVIGIAAKGDEHLDILENIVDKLDTGDDVVALIAKNSKQAIYDLFSGDGV